ncbi:MAG TPA: nicotinate-nucleotide--dimethylbenzimidazole phosphoribosyltransferase [Planctomycetota bacterium]|nr:nicotinate-nucleotide--dimethylbenzimidazole phosphoribosyltransferase [Planctomycetota bacterium]
MSTLARTLGQIGALDKGAMKEASSRQDRLTKPPGSLGRLEEIAIRVAGITGRARPEIRTKTLFTLAADHGVAAEDVSAYPQAVTREMVRNFLGGGAAINVLTRHAGVKLVVADFGVAADLPPDARLLSLKISSGTKNLLREPAMTREEAIRALEQGIDLVGDGDLVGTGDMGIANTTSASAITAVITGRPPAEVTGRGTGIDEVRLQRKIRVIEEAVALHRPKPADGLDVLSKVGGFEIGGLAGVILGAAARRIPVVLDGFISGAAALIAATLAPQVKEYLFAAHRSQERGHAASLSWLGLTPILDLHLRLGEGTGAVLAIPIVEAACKILCEMATFEEAGVSEKS